MLRGGKLNQMKSLNSIIEKSNPSKKAFGSFNSLAESGWNIHRKWLLVLAFGLSGSILILILLSSGWKIGCNVNIGREPHIILPVGSVLCFPLGCYNVSRYRVLPVISQVTSFQPGIDKPEKTMLSSLTLSANSTVNNSIRELENEVVARALSEEAIISRTANCDEYFNIIKPAALETTSGFRTDFPIAFSHLVHKEIGIFEVFMAEYYRPQNVHCIHVDKKSHDNVKKTVKNLIRCYSTRFNTNNSIYTASNTIEVEWGKSSILMADLGCMKELLEKNKRWKYFVSMAGSELPLVTAESMADILSRSSGTLFLDSYEIDKDEAKVKFGHLKLPNGLPMKKSMRNIAVPRSFAEHSIYSDVAKAWLDVIKDARPFPEEHFYATLITLKSINMQNGTFEVDNGTFGTINSRVDRDSGQMSGPACVRYNVWESWKQPCHGNWVRQLCNFAPEDLRAAYESGCFVANKFLLETQALAVYRHWNHLRELRKNGSYLTSVAIS